VYLPYRTTYLPSNERSLRATRPSPRHHSRGSPENGSRTRESGEPAMCKFA
jgi:hypothetical protein